MSWRSKIFREFLPGIARLTLVADPDGLLLEPGIHQGIRERGFELMPYEDPIAFRYACESGFRSRWDQGESIELVVVLHAQSGDIEALPFDLLQSGRKLSFSLADLFPDLSNPVVAALDRSDLDALDQAQHQYQPGLLGENASRDFVLRHVFGIAAELVKQPTDLLRLLLRRHYRDQRLPIILYEHLIRVLRQSAIFSDWPLEILVPDRSRFFAFLQERWPIFLNQMTPAGDPHLFYPGIQPTLQYAGPTLLPFDHQDIKVYLDNLFLEGFLKSVPYERRIADTQAWVKVGVSSISRHDRGEHLNKLLVKLAEAIPAADARHDAWFRCARIQAELLTALYTDNPDTSAKAELARLQAQLDSQFVAWLARWYAGLINLPALPPVMLHQIPRYLAHRLADDNSCKLALLVLDGMALDQWLIIREILAEQRRRLRFQDQVVFAWVPTITSVSRQALFAGKPPVYFPGSIHTTDKEPVLWAQFWSGQGLAANELAYARIANDKKPAALAELLTHPKLKVIGIAHDKIDRIMHGMVLGTGGMHNQVRQWTEGLELAELLDLLHKQGFQVFITSDHGNIEAEGCGRPSEGLLADLRAERVRIYSDPGLRTRVKEKFPAAVEWPPVGLPADYLALIAPARKAFVQSGRCPVSHGGLSPEELLVPWVEITRE